MVRSNASRVMVTWEPSLMDRMTDGQTALTENITFPQLLYQQSLRHFQQHCSCMALLPPANEICKGYVFTGVCLSTRGLSLCPGGSQSWGVSVHWSVSREISVQGDLCPGGFCPGGLCPGGSLSRGSLSKGVSVTETPHMAMSVWYTSYWNAFLFV